MCINSKVDESMGQLYYVWIIKIYYDLLMKN